MSGSGVRAEIPVLTYHSIDDSGSPVSVSAAEFRRQMQSLAANGWRTLTLAQFLRGHAEGRWPARTFLLTFDDGYRSVLELALPAAGECSFQGVVFVSTDRVGGTMRGAAEPSWAPDGALLDWNGLRTLASAGWSIASHSCSHRALPDVPPEDLPRELADSKATIEQKLGVPVTAMAYPYGAVSPALERMTAEHYDAAFGTRLAHVTPASRATNFERIDAYYLRRLSMIERLDSASGTVYLALRRAGRAVRPRRLRGH